MNTPSSVPAAGRWPALAGRRLLVVGASSGIGRALAVAAAGAGCPVVVAARRARELREVVDEVTASGGSAQALTCDVADVEAARALGPAAAGLLGGLDAVVASAGIAPLGRLGVLSAEQWTAVMATNVVGSAMVAAGALEPMRLSARSPGPRPAIVLISSHILARPWPGLVAYAASKAALEALGRGLREEERWLRVLNVVVGNTLTGFADGWDPELMGPAFEQWTAEGYFDGSVCGAEETAAGLLDALADEAGPEDVDLTG